MRYTVIYSKNLEHFTGQINNMLMAGWIPTGGICIQYEERINLTTYYQALTKNGK